MSTTLSGNSPLSDLPMSCKPLLSRLPLCLVIVLLPIYQNLVNPSYVLSTTVSCENISKSSKHCSNDYSQSLKNASCHPNASLSICTYKIITLFILFVTLFISNSKHLSHVTHANTSAKSLLFIRHSHFYAPKVMWSTFLLLSGYI